MVCETDTDKGLRKHAYQGSTVISVATTVWLKPTCCAGCSRQQRVTVTLGQIAQGANGLLLRPVVLIRKVSVKQSDAMAALRTIAAAIIVCLSAAAVGLHR